ncbi:MAG: hypothetical protein LUE16_10935 [Lachnospiraceae bacterium]|nr:hypothetical protein [Lachnospiraceae bacterium]
MLVRIFEYSTQIALDEGKVEGDILKVEIPHCAILYLRSWKSTPDKLQIQINTPGGAVSFNVHAMKLQEYTIEEIFEKKLFMLIPFYIFTYEKRFEEYNTNEEKLSELQAEYVKIIEQLDRLVEQKQLTSYEYRMIIDMSKNVLEGIAVRYEKVRKGVGEVFGGRILETEWDRRYRAWSAEKARCMQDKGMDDDVIEYILKSFERELKSYKTPGGKIMYEGGEVSKDSLFGTEWGERYRAGENEKARQVAFKLRDMGMGDNDIARVVDVSASKVREWFDPVKA